MGTRSTITIKKEDNSFEQVYCHWDGYPSNNGFLLLVYYQDPAKIEKLISNGNMSSLREEVDIPNGKTHTYDKPLQNVTVFYTRDRGEEMENPLTFKTLKSFAKNGNFQEYDYVYDLKNKSWFLFKPDLANTNDAFEPLIDVVKRSYEAMHEETKAIFDEFLKKPYIEAYHSLKEELEAPSTVGVPKKPKKAQDSNHPQLELEGLLEPVVETVAKKKLKV